MSNYIKAEHNGNVLELRNLRLVKGHDDSLPFAADVYFNGKHIGNASNDGWGGDAVVDVTEDETWKSFVDEINEMSWCGFENGESIKYSIAFLIDVLAYRALVWDKREYNWSTFN